MNAYGLYRMYQLQQLYNKTFLHKANITSLIGFLGCCLTLPESTVAHVARGQRGLSNTIPGFVLLRLVWELGEKCTSNIGEFDQYIQIELWHHNFSTQAKLCC